MLFLKLRVPVARTDLGYVGVSIYFPQTIAGKKEDLMALALVVPEHHLNSKIPR